MLIMAKALAISAECCIISIVGWHSNDLSANPTKIVFGKNNASFAYIKREEFL